MCLLNFNEWVLMLCIMYLRDINLRNITIDRYRYLPTPMTVSQTITILNLSLGIKNKSCRSNFTGYLYKIFDSYLTNRSYNKFSFFVIKFLFVCQLFLFATCKPKVRFICWGEICSNFPRDIYCQISNSLRFYYVRDINLCSQMSIGIIYYINFHFYHKFTNRFFIFEILMKYQVFNRVAIKHYYFTLKKPIDLIIHKRKNFYRITASKKTECNNRLLFYKKSYHSTCNYCRRLNDVTDLES